MNLDGLASLKRLWCGNNQITSLDLIPVENLEVLVCDNNQLNELSVNFLVNLGAVACGYNQIISIDVANMPSLQHLDLSGNPVGTIDITQTSVSEILCNECLYLKYAFVKNGVVSYNGPDLLVYGMMFSNTPLLEFFCIDEGEQEALATSLYNPENVTVSTTSCELSIDENIMVSHFQMIPNPVDDFVEIKSINDGYYSLTDISGKTLFTARESNMMEEFILGLPSGFYFLELTSVNSSFVKKFVKQ